MKSKMLLAATILLFSYTSLAQVPEHLRISARGMGEAGVLAARASGANVFAAANLRRVGGVMFQGVLEDEIFIQALKNISLDKRGELGRITFTFNGDNEAYYEAPYWLIEPTVKYAMSDDNAVVSLFGKPTLDERLKISRTASEYNPLLESFYSFVTEVRNCMEMNTLTPSCIRLEEYLDKNEKEIENLSKQVVAVEGQITNELEEYMSYFFFTDIHPALKSSGLGLRMLQADSLLMDTSYAEVIDVKGKKALFPGEIPVSREQTKLLGLQISSKKYQCVEKSSVDIHAWILTDVSTKYSAKVINQKVILGGTPYYYMWGADNNGEPTEIPSCTAAMKELSGSFSLRAPLTWGAVLHVSRLSALIKSLKVNKPELAKKLLSRAESMTPAMTIKSSTPRAWPRQGYEDI